MSSCNKLVGCGYEVRAEIGERWVAVHEGQDKIVAHKVFSAFLISQAFSVEMYEYEKWSNCDPVAACYLPT
jgi:hypothetical protein